MAEQVMIYGRKVDIHSCFRVICLNCGKVSYKHNYLKKFKRFFCNMDCYNEYKVKNKFLPRRPKGIKCTERHRLRIAEMSRGERANNWQGGISATYQRYRGFFHPLFKEKIRERDNHRCQRCGVSEQLLPRRLSVHHSDFYPLNNDFNNLISLCGSCHQDLHDLHRREYARSSF